MIRAIISITILKKLKLKRIWKKWHLLIAAAVIVTTFLSTVGVAGFKLSQPIHFNRHITNQSITSDIKISFNHEVSRNLNYSASSRLLGTWKVQSDVLGVKALIFHPTKPLTPATQYKITLGHLAQPLTDQTALDETVITVATEAPSDVASIQPAANGQNVSVNAAVVVTLKRPNKKLRRLSLAASVPLKSPDPTSSDDIHFVWHFAQPLAQGTSYQLALSDLNQADPAKRQLAATGFTTVAEPQITAATQTDHLYPGDLITVSFDQAMKPTDNVFSSTLPGSGKWTDPKTYQFTPAHLTPGQSYSYTVHKDSTSTLGGVISSDHVFKVAPPGSVYAANQSPHGSNVALNSTVGFTFDQPVDHASAQAHFSISPTVAGTFSWSGQTMSFHPSGLGYQTAYTASLTPGIIGTFGLPSNKTFNNVFTTTYQVTKLAVPYYHQGFGLSCEEAALRMALAFRGIFASEMDIASRAGYNPRPRDTGTNTWDNPYQMFVGDINGAQNTTGYGVYAPPIAAAAQSYGRGATASAGVSSGYIAQQIINGNPVVAWGYVHTPHTDSWNIPGGGTVAAYTGEHARTIYGVAGSPSNVVGFYIHDPIYGDLYWTAGQLMANMNAFGNTSNQVVVVF